MRLKVEILILLLLASCCRCNHSGRYIGGNEIRRHEQKLRDHFIGKGEFDVSTLISETKKISAYLKKNCRLAEANKFDSYIDVLMYGNHTIEESLNDVMKLIRLDDNSDSDKNSFWECLGFI